MVRATSPITLTLNDGGARVRAAISCVGASLQGFWVNDTALVRGSAEAARPVSASGVTLVPWPNRVRGARWEWEGRVFELEPTEPARGNALHGLLADTAFEVRELRASTVLLGARIRNAPGYPFALDVLVEYALEAAGIRVRTAVTNAGESAAPVALGAHPYLRVGDVPAAELTLEIPADEALLLDADDLPDRVVPVAGTEWDLRAGVPVLDGPQHLGFTALSARDGVVTSILRGRDAAVELWMDPRFRWLQIYLTRDFPGVGPDHLAIAVEPMTAPPDALNSGTDLHRLEPGETWTLDWGIRATGLTP
ncbi:hypothetical protein [Mycetocola saprophilus]|uniref:aldose epimerase family protein n=1 Tax=Mycetocola saprophilus TaxID=76636 RepID=UPI003BF0C85F